jgi:imidazolonepropionase-like amidohydrolase
MPGSLLVRIVSGAGLLALSIASGSPPAGLVLRHVHVVDVAGGPTRRDQRIVIADGRISAIEAESGSAPDAASVVDAAGAYVIPGLWDMHQHLAEYPGVKPDRIAQAILPLYVANGVLGVRDMGTHEFDALARLRADIESGTVLGPRLVITGRALDGVPPTDGIKRPVADDNDGRRAVRDLKRDGADFVKVYDRLTRSAYLAIADESRRQNLPFAGHLPAAIGVRDAIEAGQRSIEHMGQGRLRSETYGYLPEGEAPPLDADPLQTAILLRAMNAALGGKGYAGGWTKDTAAWIGSAPGKAALSVIQRDFGPVQSLQVLRRTQKSDGLDVPVRATHARGQRTYLFHIDRDGAFDWLPDQPDVELAGALRELAAQLKASGTWITPTLTPLSALARRQELLVRPDPRLEYMPSEVRRALDPSNDPRYKTWTDAEWGFVKWAFDRDRRLAVALHHGGARLLAGTDAVTDYCLPGFALHEELSLLVAAGLSPLEALQAATIEPAAFLGRTKDMGTVDVGKLADMVVVDGDPRADIRRVAAIRGVVRNGKYLDRARLDDLLARVKAAVAAGKQASQR